MNASFLVKTLAGLALCAVLMPIEVSYAHAQSREEVILWESVKNSSDVADFQGYLDRYPNGTFSTIAKRKIEELTKKKSENLAGSTWDYRLDWILQNHLMSSTGVPAAPTSTDKWHQTEAGQFSFGADGSCTYTNRGDQPCHWVKQGQIVTITEDKAKNYCARTWTLTIDGTRIQGQTYQPGLGRCNEYTTNAIMTARP